MLKRCSRFCARRKNGQKAWSPNATSSGAAPAAGLTMQEALQIAYRPMPPAQTVEYEEDFGANMMIHREFVSKKYRQQMSFDLSSMAYSDVELRRGQQRLADAMNRERRGVLVGSAGTANDRVHFHTDLGGDDQAGQVESARFLFNERRMQYCDAFQENLLRAMDALRKEGQLDRAVPESEDKDAQMLFSLMEACAIIYGCDTVAAQEAYYRMFGRLDLDSLEDDAQALEERVADAEVVNEELRALADKQKQSGGSAVATTGGGDQVTQIINSMPGIFDFDDDDALDGEDTTPFSSSSGSHRQPHHDHNLVEADSPLLSTVAGPSDGSAADKDSISMEEIEVPESVAPLYKAYLAHARGEGPMPSHDVLTTVASRDLRERRHWRSVVEKLVREDYSSLTSDDLKHAAKLDEQLHTIKFMDLKVGDTVKEIIALLRRESGDGSSVNRDTPLEVSPTHPERRV